MAEEKVNIDIEVKGVDESINSIKDLKKAIKDAKDEQVSASSKFGEGSKEYLEASKRVSQLKDKMDDLNDSTKSLKGSGIERASEGFNQLVEGVRKLDFDKVKVGLTAMKTALAAVGIGLIVQAVMYLVENFDKLSQGSGFLAKALRWVGDVIGDIIDLAYQLTDALGLTNSELDKQGETIKSNADKAKEALAQQTAEYDRQIAIAKASGKSAVDLEKAKQQAIIDTNKALVEQTIAYVRNGGVLNDEQKKLLTEQLNAIKNAVNQQKVIDITDKKEALDRHKKFLEDKKKADLEDWNLTLKVRREFLDGQAADDERLAKERLEKLKQEKQAELDYINEQEAIGANNSINFTNQVYDVKKLRQQQEAEDYIKNRDNQINITKQGLQATQQLTDLFFAYKLNKAKGDEKAEIEIKKKQFNLNKAFGVTTAVIDGVMAVQKALSSAPPPFNFVLAGISGVMAAVNVAKIASSKFDATSSSASSPSGTSTTMPSVSLPQAPQISTNQNNLNTPTFFNSQGQRTDEKQQAFTVKAVVVETDITNSQDRINRITKQATF